MADNPALMLIRLFIKIGLKDVTVAGLDGYSATSEGLHDFLGGEDDVDPALFIQPVILDRQAHAVQQDTVQDLGVGGQRLELRVCEQHLGDAIE